MILQERDRRMMRRCYEQQFLLMEHVESFFKESDWRGAYRRIKLLERAGLVVGTDHPTQGRRRIIRLTKNGLALVRQFHPVEIPQRKKIDFETLEHDSIVTSVSIRLHDLWDGVWVPERALKKDDYAQIPDGVVAMDSGSKVAVEVENSLKGKTRFLTILDRWRHVTMRLILFVATEPRIFKYLQGYLLEGPRGLPFGLVQWQELKSGVPLVWCPKGELDVFSRRAF